MYQRPSFRRRKLARRLRQLREQAGLTVDAAAIKLDKNRNALYRVETGETKASVHLVRSMMDLYGDYSQELLDQVREALEPGWWTEYGLPTIDYIDAETDASAKCELAVTRIPALLQTEAYMRTIFEDDAAINSERELISQTKVRLVRQKRLHSTTNPLRFSALIDESALWQNVGGVHIMLEQLNHLIEVAALPHVTIRMLPRSAGAYAERIGHFAVLEFADPDDQSMLFVSYPAGVINIEDFSEVRRARMTFDQLMSKSLNTNDSLKLIRHWIEQLTNEI